MKRKIRYVGHGVGLESPETPFWPRGTPIPYGRMTLALELRSCCRGERWVLRIPGAYRSWCGETDHRR